MLFGGHFLYPFPPTCPGSEQALGVPSALTLPSPHTHPLSTATGLTAPELLTRGLLLERTTSCFFLEKTGDLEPNRLGLGSWFLCFLLCNLASHFLS